MAFGNLGLVIDMSGWRKSCEGASGIFKKSFASLDAKTGGFGSKIASAFGGAGSAASTAAVAIGGVATSLAVAVAGAMAFYKFMVACCDAGKELNKAWRAVHESLNGLTSEQKKAFNDDKIRDYAKSVSTVFGYTQAEIIKTYGVAIARGSKTMSQTQKLVTLAAMISKKTPQSFADSMRIVMDVANGKVMALRKLDQQLGKSGSVVKDAAAGLDLLTKTFGTGDIPMVSATDRMNASLKNLMEEIGVEALPSLKAMTQAIGDFATGLISTQDGTEVIKELAYYFSLLLNFTKELSKTISNAFEFLWGTTKGFWSFLMTIFAGISEALLNLILAPLQWILQIVEAIVKALGGMGKLGSQEIKNMRTELSKTKDDWAKSSYDGFGAAYDVAFKKDGTVVTKAAEFTEYGKRAREKETKERKDEMKKAAAEGYGSTRVEDEREGAKKEKEDKKAEEKAKKKAEKDEAKRKKDEEKIAKKRATAIQNLSGGVEQKQIRINIVSTTPNRFHYS